jgi:hypothetical protein
VQISDMKNPRIGLYFGEIVTYEADITDSRTPVINEDGSEGWGKPHYIDDIGPIDTPVHKITLQIGDLISLTSAETGKTITGKIVGKSQDGETLIIGVTETP